MYNTNERCLLFDESGNLGSDGRYFVISCIDTYNGKEVHNILKRKIKQAKILFPELGSLHVNEIKAKDAYPCVKYHILESICTKSVKISYIVADLKHVKETLLVDKNIFYNYMFKILLTKIITDKDKNTLISILSDEHITKVSSRDSLFDYIKAWFNYDHDYNINFKCDYLDSNATNAYGIQAADYVANALYTKYEFSNNTYTNIITSKIDKIQTFPYDKFGK